MTDSTRAESYWYRAALYRRKADACTDAATKAMLLKLSATLEDAAREAERSSGPDGTKMK
jgi:hypothetical protein